MWECFNGIIPEGKVIDHINDIKDDNRLCNLQLTTQQENCKKSAKNHDYSFVVKNHENKKCIKATDIETNEFSYYDSLYATQQHLGVNAGIVSMCCQGINNVKSGISKKDGKRYKFEYVKKENMPDDSIKTSRKKLSEEEQRKKKTRLMLNKEWYCEICNNGNNYTLAGKWTHLKTQKHALYAKLHEAVNK